MVLPVQVDPVQYSYMVLPVQVDPVQYTVTWYYLYK